jgi:serine/threonine-protein kinase HipA
MNYRITVWEQTLGRPREVGEVACEIAGDGRLRSAFRYSQDYLADPESYALDPVSLPLKPGTQEGDASGVIGVLDDSLPDDWGRNLLIRKCRIARQDQNFPRLLLALGGSGLGALAFTDKTGLQPDAIPDCPIRQLSRLMEEADRYESGDVQQSDIAELLGAGSSAGGARPKAVVWDERSGLHYLAKFPSVRDRVDVVGSEAATMILAGKAGLAVPPTRLVQAAGRPVLLVERFDILTRGRRHMVSFQTLLKARGYYQHRYHDLLGVVRKVSAEPAEDSGRLFRQMVFNAVIGNTDDHLKNFMMVYEQGKGWRLSPAFDLVPDIGRKREHVLFFDLDPDYPGLRALEGLGRRWGIRGAEGIVADVVQAVSGWKDEFSRQGVPEKDIALFTDIDRHLSRE